MKTLSTDLNTEKDAAQTGWAELVDIYLKAAITTPWGTVSTLRLCTVPGGTSFFTPTVPPEPTGTQGDAQDYEFWPLKRSPVQCSGKNTADRLTLTASNVSAEWAEMLDAVSFYDCWVVIRKIATSIDGPAATDCVVLFIGQIDSWASNPEQITFTVSGDLTALNIVLPRENMHQNCRFNWADDWCTKLRWLPAHYAAKTVGASSTTTQINSAGLTEDAGASGSYGTDEVDALVDGSITASSQDTGGSALACLAYPAWDAFRRDAGHGLSNNDAFVLAGTTPPGGLSFGTTYYVQYSSPTWWFVRATPGGPRIDITSVGADVTFTRLGYHGYNVRASNSRHWKFTLTDWGTLDNGYYEIDSGQEGYANAALKPYLQFDFGSAKALRLWRIKTVDSASPASLPRLIAIFSSADAATWTFESYYELPPVGGVYYDVRIPSASSRRYWRICIRSKWNPNADNTALEKVQAYTGGRHYWRHGRVTFDAATATAALQGLSRRVMESYSGQVIVAPPLPVAPASGDTLKIERGCGRSFADCCERKNTENFGGFLDLANQTVIR